MKKVGLVLSGGGARGCSHVGVLKALDKNNIKISSISGSSMGSVIGAAYSSGIPPVEIEKILQNVKTRDLLSNMDFSFTPQGLVKGEKIMRYLMQFIKARTFEELKIPLAMNAVDLISEKEVVFNKGDLIAAISASTSVPTVFVPKKINGAMLVDGALRNPLGLGNTRKCDFSIIVNVGTGFGKNINKKKLNLIDIVKISVNITQDELIRLKLQSYKKKYVLIEPNVGMIQTWDTKNVKKAIFEGEMATLKSINEIKRLYSKE